MQFDDWRTKNSGFTLIELLIVLAIIAAIASVILPNLGLTLSSQMNTALREYTNTVRSTYDSAVLTGRVHRLVLQMKTGQYWAEAAPIGYEGRPPVEEAEQSAAATFDKDARLRLLEELEKQATEPRKSSDTVERAYSFRSPLLIHRSKLKEIKWNEVDDAVLYRRALTGSVAFASVITDAMPNALNFSDATPKQTAFIYFFPSGSAIQASVQLTTLSDANTLNDTGPKFTVILDSLTGQSEIREGFQEADFVKK